MTKRALTNNIKERVKGLEDEPGRDNNWNA